MTARERQIEHALQTRARQVERHGRIEEIIENQPTHHGWGVCVKDRTRCMYHPDDDADADEWLAYRAYERAREDFWRKAEQIAREHGFHGVWQEGRSGGWLVVSPQPRTDDMWPEELDEYARLRFGPCMAEILELMEHVRDKYQRRAYHEGALVVEASTEEGIEAMQMPANRVCERCDEDLPWASPQVTLCAVCREDERYAGAPDVPVNP